MKPSYCTQCGSRVSEGQRTCSMCYGDIDHGKDNYYRDRMEEADKEDADIPPEEDLPPDDFDGGYF